MTPEAKCRTAPAISSTGHTAQVLAALIWVASPAHFPTAATFMLAGSPPHLVESAACREEDARALGLGSTRKAEDACAAHAPLAIAAWKGRGSLSVLVSKGMYKYEVIHEESAYLWLRGTVFSSGL